MNAEQVAAMATLPNLQVPETILLLTGHRLTDGNQEILMASSSTMIPVSAVAT